MERNVDDFIDLRVYIRAVFRRWAWIGGLTLAFGLVALAGSWLLPNTYSATAILAVTRMGTLIDPGAGALTEAQGELTDRDRLIRLEGLKALVQSVEIAEQVATEIGDQLPPEDRSATALRQMVNGRVSGDLVTISVLYSDPEKAALIANSWASAYQDFVNSLYSPGSRDKVVSFAAEAASAYEDFQGAQAELEVFLDDNEIAALQRDIASRQALLDMYQTAMDDVLSETFLLRVSTNEQVLSDYYEELWQTERLLADAQALREQVSSSGGSAAVNLASVVALVGLYHRAYGGEAAVDLQFDLAAAEAEGVRVADVEALIETLNGRQDEAEKRIAILPAELAAVRPQELTLAPDHPLVERVAELDDEIAGLQARLEAQEAAQRELESGRDLAWNTYQVLTQKEIEEQIAASSRVTEVRLASSAALPGMPERKYRLRNAAVAAALGLGLAVSIVVGLEWWREETPRVDETERDTPAV